MSKRFNGEMGDLHIKEVINENTINIFTDGSVTKNGVSYGIVVFYGYDIIYSEIREGNSDESINRMELKGIRLALDYARFYCNQYSNINIYSDSLYSVDMIHRGIYNWFYDSYAGCFLDRYGDYAKNQDLIIEIVNIYNNLKKFVIPSLSIIYVPGHVSVKNIKDLCNAKNKFIKNNNLGNICMDLNMVRYFGGCNDIVDNKVNSTARHHSDKKYENPLLFESVPIQIYL